MQWNKETRQSISKLLCIERNLTTTNQTKPNPLKPKNISKGNVEETERHFHILQMFKMGSVFFCQWDSHDNP